VNDVRRIAFVAERFFELQGLAPTVFGGTLIFWTLLQHAVDGPAGLFNTPQSLLLPIMASNLALVPLQKMYRRTYGDVVATRTARFIAGLPLIIVYAGWLTEMFLSFHRPYAGPCLAAVALAAVSCWIVLRDWPWRLHHLVPAAAGLAAAIVTASVPASPDRFGIDPARGEAYLLAYALMGLGVVFSGLLDHRLLAASFGEPSATGTPVAASTRLSVSFWMGFSTVASAGGCLWLSEKALPLALPLIVMPGPIAVTFIASMGQTARAFRDLGKRRPSDEGPRIQFDGDVLVAILLIALTATVDSAFHTSASPTLLTLAIGLSSLLLAAAKLRERWYLLLWTLGAGVTLYATADMSPARAFTVLLLTMSSAWTLTALVRSRHVFTLHRSDHADAL
jgi:hypothetical protein